MLVQKKLCFQDLLKPELLNFCVPPDNGVIKGLLDFMASVFDKTVFNELLRSYHYQLIYDQAFNNKSKS